MMPMFSERSSVFGRPTHLGRLFLFLISERGQEDLTKIEEIATLPYVIEMDSIHKQRYEDRDQRLRRYRGNDPALLAEGRALSSMRRLTLLKMRQGVVGDTAAETGRKT
jgi:hypothetical protein